MALSREDLDTLVRITYAEAGNEPAVGQVAVLHVIKNRVESGKYGGGGGSRVHDVVFADHQFEPTMTASGRKNMQNVPPEKYRQIAAMAEGVFSGQLEDPTGGATHFANVSTVRDRNSGGVTSWMREMWSTKQDIGNHSFFGGNRGAGAAVVAKMGGQANLDLLDGWKAVLASSPKQLTFELSQMEGEDAKELLAKIAANNGDKDALTKAADLVRNQAKAVLEKHGMPANANNLALAELFGGHTAVELIKDLNANPGKKLSECKYLDLEAVKAYRKLGNTGLPEGADLGDATVKDLITSVSSKAEDDKKKAIEATPGIAGNEVMRKLFEGAMGEMGPVGFILLLFAALALNEMGINLLQFFMPSPEAAPQKAPEEKAPAPTATKAPEETKKPESPDDQAKQAAKAAVPDGATITWKLMSEGETVQTPQVPRVTPGKASPEVKTAAPTDSAPSAQQIITYATAMQGGFPVAEPTESPTQAAATPPSVRSSSSPQLV